MPCRDNIESEIEGCLIGSDIDDKSNNKKYCWYGSNDNFRDNISAIVFEHTKEIEMEVKIYYDYD